MQKNYTLYKAEELLQDDYFLRSIKHPTAESQQFWTEQALLSPALNEEIKIARLILSGLSEIPAAKEEFITSRVETIKRKIDYQNRELNRSRRSIRFLTVSGLVAAAVTLLIILNIPHQVEEPDVVDYGAITRNFDLQAGDTNQIRLVLGEGKELVIEEEDVNIDYSQEDRIQLKSGDKELVAEKEEETIRFNQLFVPKGKRSSLILSDGTQVWVNSDSRIIYPERFAEGKREIYIEGEVYLDVHNDTSRPFVVKTSSLDVTVLGTEFNVSAYPDEDEQYVVLVNGKVEVEIPGRDITVMRPAEKYTLDAIGPHVSSVDINEYVSWKLGYYQFQQEKLSRVFDKLNRFYGIDFSYTEKVQSLTCSGKLNLTDNIDEVLKILQKAASIKVERDDNTIYIDVKP